MAAKVDLSAYNLDELNALIDEATKARDGKIESKRAELLKQLSELDAISAPKSTNGTGRVRNSPKPLYRTPDGSVEWSGRGGIPRAFKELGASTKQDLEKYRIRD